MQLDTCERLKRDMEEAERRPLVGRAVASGAAAPPAAYNTFAASSP